MHTWSRMTQIVPGLYWAAIDNLGAYAIMRRAWAAVGVFHQWWKPWRKKKDETDKDSIVLLKFVRRRTTRQAAI